MNTTVTISSCNFDGTVQFSLDKDINKSQNWGDYAKAAAWSLIFSGLSRAVAWQ